MKHIITALTALVLIFSNKATAQEKGLLYEISGNGIETSYLYGTIHLMPADQFKMKPSIKKAFDNSIKIILELDMDDPGLQMAFMKNMTFTDGNSLKKLFTEEEYKVLDSTLIKTNGVGLAMLDTMKPFMINTMLIKAFFTDQLASYEGTFVEWAMAQEKEIIGLETVEEQVQIFDNIPYEDQADQIIESLENITETRDMFDQMLELYLDEDVDGLYKMFGDFYDDDATMMSNLLDNRNKNWIPKLVEELKEGQRFIGIGAGHLGGESGIINLLRQQGFEVTVVE